VTLQKWGPRVNESNIGAGGDKLKTSLEAAIRGGNPPLARQVPQGGSLQRVGGEMGG